MPSLFSFAVRAFVLSLLCSVVLSREKQSRARRLEDIIQKGQSVDKRDICIEDDTLISFQHWIVDSAGYCSSLLSIVDFTQTLPRISRTTTTTVSTTYNTVTATTTVPAVTVFSTQFVPTLAKREDPTPTLASGFYRENPYAAAVYAKDVNDTIAASVYSACSCLHLKPSTVNALTISSTTRTLSGLDTEETTFFVYVTAGTTTSILTRQGNPFTLSSTVSVIPIPVTTSIASLGTGISAISTAGPSIYSTLPYSNFTISIPSVTGVSSGLPPTPTNNLTIPPFPASGSPVPSFNISITSQPTSGFPINSANLSITPGPTSGFPINSANLSITLPLTSASPINSANLSFTLPPISASPINSANLSITSRPTSGFPLQSVNYSVSSRPTSGLPIPPANISYGFPIPTTNLSITSQPSGTPVPSPNLTLTSQAISGFPTAPANLSSYTSTSVMASTYTYPIPPVSYSTFYSTGVQTFVATYPTATTSTTSNIMTAALNTTSSAPTAPVSSLNINKCPGLNGTTVILPDGQVFAVVCGTNYGGPVDVGLYENSFGQCVQDCGIANNGFSAVRCRGVTYMPYNSGTAVNCFLKNAAGLEDYTADPNSVSAVLQDHPSLSVTIALPTAFPTPGL